MAELRTETEMRRVHRYGSFIDRYPEYPQWLDGQVWALDVAAEIEIHETVSNFRSSMHYQAHQFGLRVSTKLIREGEKRILLIQAYSKPEPQ